MPLQLTGAGRARLLGAGVVAATGPATVAVSPGNPPPVGGGGGPLTALAFYQPMPLPSQAQYQVTIGRIIVTGGTGPYVYSNTSSNGRYLVKPSNGVVSIPIQGDITLSADTITVTVTDALGGLLTTTLPVVKRADTSPTLYLSHLGFDDANVTGNPFAKESLIAIAYGGDHSSKDVVAYTVGGPSSALFGVQYGILGPAYAPSIPVPAGSYPIHITATSATATLTLDYTWVINPVPAIGPFSFVPAILSTSQPPGTLVGQAFCTTPTNARHWSIAGPGAGSLLVDSGSGAVTLKLAVPVGPLVFDLTCVDQLATRTQRFTIQVVQGVVLPPTNMTMAVTAGLDNYVMNQVIGTPQVTGITGTPAWSLVFEEYYTSTYLPVPLFVMDTKTGRTVAPHKLANWTYYLICTCTDGINTCTQTFPVPIAWVANARTIHVGEGQTAANPAGYGFEHLTQILNLFRLADVGVYAGAKVIVHPNANKSYYAEDNGNGLNGTNFGSFVQLGYGWNGPVHIVGATPNGERPLLGGTIGAAFGGADPGGKGFFNLGHGDFIIEGLDIRSCCEANGTGGTSISAIRKNADVTGDLTVLNCNLQDCPDAILTGYGPYRVFIRNNTMSNTGNVFNPSTHGSYIGACTELQYTDNISYNTTSGHNLKTRAKKATILRSRFLDGERGSASCQVEIPQGGNYLMDGCFFHKGGNQQNAGMIKFNAEGPYYPEDRRISTLLVKNSTFFAAMAPLGYSGEPIALWNYSMVSPVDGSPCAITSSNNSFYLAGAARKYIDQNGVGTFTETGSTMLAAPPALDFSDPGTAVPPAPRAGFWHDIQDGGTGGGEYPGFDHVQIDPGRDDIRIPVSTAAGTVIFTCSAYGADFWKQYSPTDARVNPFGAGSVWSISQVGQANQFSSPSVWAPVGRYAIDSVSGAFSVAGPLVAGLDFVKIKVLSPDGVTFCMHRLYITIL